MRGNFGHFATAFTVLGLNDYQNKGRAEIGYWPKVVPLLRRDSDPHDSLQLIAILEPFYSNERFAKQELERLHRFITSSLGREIWGCSAASIATDFAQLWEALGRIMGQRPTDKTIAFAMKCLALSLLMVGEESFDFGAIPVPVDSRIRSVSLRLGLSKVDEAGERDRWQEVLGHIRGSRPNVTMVHLDSLLWQIGTLSRERMQAHLAHLGAGEFSTQIPWLFSAAEDRPAAVSCGS